jgi:ParB-like chromosome segregation protein Spo0J
MDKSTTTTKATFDRLQIEYWPIDRLIPYARNARTHSPAQVAEIAGSIRAFGFSNPILVGEGADVIAGHGRLAAARKLGLTEAPVIVLRGLSDTQRRQLVLADNRIALNAGWDAEMFSLELADLHDRSRPIDTRLQQQGTGSRPFVGNRRVDGRERGPGNR